MMISMETSEATCPDECAALCLKQTRGTKDDCASACKHYCRTSGGGTDFGDANGEDQKKGG